MADPTMWPCCLAEGKGQAAAPGWGWEVRTGPPGDGLTAVGPWELWVWAGGHPCPCMNPLVLSPAVRGALAPPGHQPTVRPGRVPLPLLAPASP